MTIILIYISYNSGLLNRYAKCKDSTDVVGVQNDYLASLEQADKQKNNKDLYPPSDDDHEEDDDQDKNSDDDSDDDDLLFRNTNRQTAFTAFDDEDDDEEDEDDDDEDEDDEDDDEDEDEDDHDNEDHIKSDTKVIVDKLGNTHITH